MADRLGEPLVLDDAAAAAAFSKYHFHRIFKAVAGETPSAFLRRLRLEKAAHLLAFMRDTPVTDVAMDCGFATPSAFARDFKARFGVTPMAYRKRPHDGASSGASDPSPPPDGDYSWSIVHFDAMRLAEARREGRYDRAAGAAWSALMRRWFSSGRRRPPARAIGIAWDNPGITDEPRCRYSACARLDDAEALPDGLDELRLPENSCLVLRWRGHRRGYSAAYDYLYRIALAECDGLPADSPAFEVYDDIGLGPPVAVDFCLPLAL
jgi:AraC family transcriptional regulator